MTFQPGANLYTQGFGSAPENVEVPHYDVRAPTTTDTIYPVGKRWIYINVAEYTLLGLTSIGGVLAAIWSTLGVVGGALNTLTGDSGGAITPAANNITLAGTGSQITTTGAGSTITFSIPSTFLAPGSIASTTTLTSGTSLAVTTSATIGTTLAVTGATTLTGLLTANGGETIVGVSNINVTGAAATTIGNVTSTLAVNAPTTLTLASGAATGLIINTSAGTGVGETITTSSATVDALRLAGGGILTAATSVAAGASPQTANNRFGQVIFSGVSIASGASQAFVINNTTVTGASTVVGVWMSGATAGSALSIASIVTGASTITITVTNGTSATMVTSVANIKFVFWVMT